MALKDYQQAGLGLKGLVGFCQYFILVTDGGGVRWVDRAWWVHRQVGREVRLRKDRFQPRAVIGKFWASECACTSIASISATAFYSCAAHLVLSQPPRSPNPPFPLPCPHPSLSLTAGLSFVGFVLGVRTARGGPVQQRALSSPGPLPERSE